MASAMWPQWDFHPGSGSPETIQRADLLRLLADAAGHLLTARDGDALVRGVYERIAPALDLHAYFNFMVNDRADAMYLASCSGIPEEEARAISRLEFGQAVCGTAALLRRPLAVSNVQQSDDPKVELVRGYGMRAYACNPLMAGERLLGTLSFGTRSRDRFGGDELEFFRTLAQYVAVAEERRRMVAALQREAALVDLARDAIIATGLDGSIEFLNRGAEDLYGWTAAEARGRNYAELLSTEPEVRFPEIGRALRTRSVWEAELRQRRRDGRVVGVWSRWAACRAGGEPTGFLILELDSSERRRMEERIRQAQKLEGLAVLAGGVAHDFNNLLTSILGNASLLEDMVPPDGQPMLRQVIRGAELAGHLTRQLRTYAGEGARECADIDLSLLVRNTAELLRVSVPKSIEIRLDLEPGVPSIRGDRGQLQQVLMNLVINAGEAIGEKKPGTITVRTGMETLGGDGDGMPAGVYGRVTVSDTGCGIDPETAARIFDPFFTTKAMGRGLGLSVVAGIVRASGGSIAVDSRPGEGASFRLLFPAA
ncbi:MAG: GAF domain-containing protein [Bryobacterales bacterium]|nr:GAF domain-containing protein [Bryobacterales bacterium]